MAPVIHAPAPVSEGTGATVRRRDLWQWIVGLVGGLVVVGPGLAPGSLLNLDLVLTPRLQVPPGIWGLGPGLPRSVPIAAPLAWISALIGGPLTGKVLIVVSLMVAFAGAARLVAATADAGALTQAGAVRSMPSARTSSPAWGSAT